MTDPLSILPTRQNYWERLGHDVTGATTAEEALTRAGMNWGLIVLPSPTGTFLTDTGVITSRNPGRYDLLRDDNYDRMTGDISKDYVPVSNRDAFGVLDAVARTGGARFLSAGEGDYGRRCHVFMNWPEAEVLVGGKDLVQAHLLARTRHDGGGTISLETRLSRQVCTNGMTVQIPGASQRISVRHTRNATERITLAEDALRTMRRYVKGFAAAVEHMLSTPMTPGEFETYIDNLWPRPETPVAGQDNTRAAQATMTRWASRRAGLMDLFRYAETNHLGRNTAWGAYNTVTEWVDWYSETRRGEREDRLAHRQMEMAGQAVKDRVFANLAALN